MPRLDLAEKTVEQVKKTEPKEVKPEEDSAVKGHIKSWVSSGKEAEWTE